MTKPFIVKGFDDQGERINSKKFAELIRQALKNSDTLQLETYGQHNIGCRLYADHSITIEVTGPVGQRLGAMGMPGTTIICDDSASDDVGYLNVGAEIIVRGDAANGVCNAMAAGKVMVGGSIGARGLTMTKWNPSYSRPELWVLGSVGDTFAEFNCGGIGIVCGVEAKNPDNVLGYRPCVGMVGGWIYYRGTSNDTLSQMNARQIEPDDDQWQWLMEHMPVFLEKIGRPELLASLSIRAEWKILVAISPEQRREIVIDPISMAEYREKHWKNFFPGGEPLADLAPGIDRSPIPVIVTGDLRLKRPLWENPGSGGKCRDCHLCETLCPPGAIKRSEKGEGDDASFEYLSEDTQCIGCGFCRDACPVAVWKMVPLK